MIIIIESAIYKNHNIAKAFKNIIPNNEDRYFAVYYMRTLEE